MDLSARFGGEEFVSILTDCPRSEALRFAEEVRTAVGAMDFGWGGVTLSAGVATFELGMGAPDVLLAAADRALYAAKEGGRNRVVATERTPLASRVTAGTVRESPESLDGVRILLVDDDRDGLRATSRALSRLGCHVTATQGAREAVQVVRSGEVSPDLVVTDIVMPEMSGFTLVDLVGRLKAGVPALYISGYPQEEVYWGGTPGSKSTFLAKPFLLDELERAVRDVLGIMSAATSPGTRSASAASAIAPARSPGHLRDGGGRWGQLLIVDDDPGVVRALTRVFERVGYSEPRATTDPRAVEELVAGERPDLVVLDLHMPHLDGFEVLERLKELEGAHDFLPVIVLTGDQDDAARRRALELGASDFLTKPVEITEALARVRNLLDMRLLHRRVLEHNEALEHTVAVRTAELADTRTEIIHRLARAAEYRDDISGRHAARVGLLSALLATELGMSMEARELIQKTAPLHDVGKIAVPDAVLKKDLPLTAHEFELMKTHTTVGAKILEGSAHLILRTAASIAEHHHEHWDGRGYPHGLSGQDIPIEARIVSVADAFDVLTHRRPYKPPVPPTAALQELIDCRGTQFDPDVVDAFEATAERVGPDALPELVDPADPWKDIVA